MLVAPMLARLKGPEHAAHATHRPARRVRPCCSRSRPPWLQSPQRWVRPSAGQCTGRTGNAAPAAPSAAARRSPPFRATPPIPEASYFGSQGSALRPRHGPVPARAAPLPILPARQSQFCRPIPSRRPASASRRPIPCSPAVARSPPTRRPSPETSPAPAAAAPSRPSPRPDRFETAICHQYRTLETLTCDKVLSRHADPDARLLGRPVLTRVTADPAPPASTTWPSTSAAGPTATDARLHDRQGQRSGLHGPGLAGRPRQPEHADPADAGPSRIDGFFCYQTYYSQSCAGPTAPSARGSTTPARARATTAPTPSRCRPRSASATPGTTSARRWRRARNESRATPPGSPAARWRSACSHPYRATAADCYQTAETCVEAPRPAASAATRCSRTAGVPRVLHLRLAEQHRRLPALARPRLQPGRFALRTRTPGRLHALRADLAVPRRHGHHLDGDELRRPAVLPGRRCFDTGTRTGRRLRA